MALHIVKLCVGVSSVEELQEWVDECRAARLAAGEPDEQIHTTRMVPRRIDEILDGGSLYWVIKGNIQVRQPIVDIRPFNDAEGIGRCHLVLYPELTLTRWQPRRAFQGWRYLKHAEAPVDMASGSGAHALPQQLRVELAELGLL